MFINIKHVTLIISLINAIENHNYYNLVTIIDF